MIELIQITHDPEFARRCDALAGLRLWVDLERNGKAERQAGRNTFISTHTLDDVGRVKAALQRSRLMVRVNPLNPDTDTEVNAVLAQGAESDRRVPYPEDAAQPSAGDWNRAAAANNRVEIGLQAQAG